tara:strand:- start:316 stop:711 length:396 start_codon:yes stop_codon:yes gene_type:complete
MNELVEYDNLNLAKKEGVKKLENNEFFQDLCGLMQNEQFKRFFNKHMGSWTDIKCSVTYMHLYNQFKIKYKELNNKELEEELAVYLLAKIMRDKTLRTWSISTVDKFLTNNKINFFEEFETIILTNRIKLT